MEFNRLADVEVVETANDTDKVLIEQNGEIKRVPKTEVGGSGGGSGGGNGIVITTEDMQSFTANMTLTEALEAFNKHELVYGVIYATMQGMSGLAPIQVMVDMTAEVGMECMLMVLPGVFDNSELYWTADGITTEPPM